VITGACAIGHHEKCPQTVTQQVGGCEIVHICECPCHIRALSPAGTRRVAAALREEGHCWNCGVSLAVVGGGLMGCCADCMPVHRAGGDDKDLDEALAMFEDPEEESDDPEEGY
jgi:hypothetical protein